VELRDTTNVIIHNAWKVDFNYSLSSFEAVHIRGIQNFIHFSASSKLRPRVVFISSISSVSNCVSVIPAVATWNIVPEMIAPTPMVAQPTGYAESKAVAEQLLAAAAKLRYIKTSIVRIGQIAGPIGEENGAKWNEHEWFALLLKTSKALGKVPDASMLNKIDWVPVDVSASVLLDLSLSPYQNALQVFHLVHPSLAAWSELLPTVQAYLGNARAVSMQEWVSELEKVDTGDLDAVAAKPAVKILGFFKEMLQSKDMGVGDLEVDTRNSEKVSPRLAQLGPVTEEWIGRWMRDCRFGDFRT
jgi:thioester reductase-like protein